MLQGCNAAAILAGKSHASMPRRDLIMFCLSNREQIPMNHAKAELVRHAATAFSIAKCAVGQSRAFFADLSLAKIGSAKARRRLISHPRLTFGEPPHIGSFRLRFITGDKCR